MCSLFVSANADDVISVEIYWQIELFLSERMNVAYRCCSPSVFVVSKRNDD